VPLSLDTILVQPSNSGSFTGTPGTASLPTPTTAGSTLLVCAASTATVTSTGFTDDSGTQTGSARAFLLRKSNVAAGETSWTLSAQAGTVTRWTVYELAGLDPDAPVDVKLSTTTTTASGTTASSGTLARSSTYDGVVVAVHASLNGSATTPVTWSGHTNSFTETDEGAADDGVSKAVDLSVSMLATQQIGTFQTTATASATLTAGSPAGATIVCYAAQGAKREANVAHFWAFFPGVSSTPAGLGTGNAGARYFETVTGSPAVTADGLQLTASASAQAVAAASITTTGVASKGHVVRVRLRLDSLSGDLELARLVDSGGADTVLRYVSASGKLGVKVGTGTEQLSAATITTGVWYDVDVRAMGFTTARTADWRVDDGTGPVDQAQASVTAGAVLGSLTPQLGWTASSTGTVTFAYAVYSVRAGHYPLGPFTFALLGPDPAGTVTISGTTTNFNTFTANGTMAAWNATTARDAIDEVPPTVGASADGLAQVTAAATDYVEVPMATYQAVPNGNVRAVRMLACGWAAAATAATIGFRGYEGSAETTLFATADPGFDNTSTPGWVCALYRPTGGWTQAKLDALAFRVGFSDDATPDIGIHALYAEVAAQTAATQGMFGTSGDVTVSAQLDPNSAGVLGLATTTVQGKGAVLHYEVSGTPTDVTVPPAASDSRTLDALDAPTVGYVAIYPDPEGVPDS
jgi:hypothetical protein